MLIEELKEIARESGVVGAGGAGFPTYAKMTDKADTIILNCVECEPLLKLHRQLLTMHAEEIVLMLDEVRKTINAKEAVIGIKSTYAEAIEALKEVLVEYPKVRLCTLRPAYPMGDEVMLIYEATGRVVKPGGLPIDEKVIVFNTETIYNLYRSVKLNENVTDKLVSIVGEIDRPLTIRVPIGTSVKEAIGLAGKIKTDNPAYLLGGPMMGTLGTENTPITKTTNAIIILPKEHELIMRMNKNINFEVRKASSSCCQCRTCTDLCPRYMLGHPIEPHSIMRAVSNNDTSDLSVFINSMYCCGCGICEKYACPQSLSPKSIIQDIKTGLRMANIKPEKCEPSEVNTDRELRKVPVKRLEARLGLLNYDLAAPFVDTTQTTNYVKIQMRQHIGAPAIPKVKVGDLVKKGQKIADAAEGLSVAIHCSIDGKVEKVTEKEIVVRAC